MTKGSIFVFGSNLAGRHGKGAALAAKNDYGAIYGQGMGRQGQSYAIPTKDAKLNALPLERIKNYVDEFINYARNNPNETFFVTRVGCGLAGYTDDQMGPLFKKAPANCELPKEWKLKSAVIDYLNVSDKRGDKIKIYRCPECDAWDYALQGDVAPGIYKCTECLNKFEVLK